MSKKILIISDSVTNQTGYSTVASNIMKHVSDGNIIGHLGFATNLEIPTPKDVHCYTTTFRHKDCGLKDVIHYYFDDKVEYITPTLECSSVASLPVDKQCKCGHGIDQGYAESSVFYVIQHFKPDIVVSINDVWGIHHINYLKSRRNFKHIAYLAIDSECFPYKMPTKHGILNTIEFLSSTDKVVVFTDWAKETIHTTVKLLTGGKVPSNLEVIPHGVDTNDFFPIDDKVNLRKKYFGNTPGIEDAFLLGCVARNQPRKRLDAIFQTLRLLIDKYEKKGGKKFMAHFHCVMKEPIGWDLLWLAQYYGVNERCIFDDNLKPLTGVDIQTLNEIINTYDVHLLPTNSEGWGLPILESMACGVPNVISNYSAHGDWAKGTALMIKLAAKIHDPGTNHIKGIVDIEHAAKQISLLYNSKKMHRDYSRRGIKLANKLQWKNVCDEWNTLFDVTEIDENPDKYDVITFKGDIQPLPDNPIETEFELMEG